MTCAFLINYCFRAGHWRTCAHNGLLLCLGPNQVFCAWVLVLQPISANYWLGSCIVSSDEIRLYAIGMLHTWTE